MFNSITPLLPTGERVIEDTHAPVMVLDGLLSKPSLTFTKWLFWIQIVCSLLETKALWKNWNIRNIPSISKRSELGNPYFYQSYIYTSLCLQVHVCIIVDIIFFVLFSQVYWLFRPGLRTLFCHVNPQYLDDLISSDLFLLLPPHLSKLTSVT